MNRLETGIKNAFIDRGIMGEKWRVKITRREIIGRSDWGKIGVEVYRPKKRKPCTVWDLAIYVPKNQIHWDKSTFCNL